MTQDDAREEQLIKLFDLERPKGYTRDGTDAVLCVDENIIEFELKSLTSKTSKSVTSVRNFNKNHVKKWENKHWIVGFYKEGILTHCKYATPQNMSVWINQVLVNLKIDMAIVERISLSVRMSDMKSVLGRKKVYSLQEARKLQKGRYKKIKGNKIGYSPEQMLEFFRDRVKYLIDRGAMPNNPHLPVNFFDDLPTISNNHASELRSLVHSGLINNQWKQQQPSSLSNPSPLSLNTLSI